MRWGQANNYGLGQPTERLSVWLPLLLLLGICWRERLTEYSYVAMWIVSMYFVGTEKHSSSQRWTRYNNNKHGAIKRGKAADSGTTSHELWVASAVLTVKVALGQ